MRKLIMNVLMLSVLVVASLCSAGCDGVGKGTSLTSKEKALVGKWKPEKGGMTIQFFNEGTTDYALRNEAKYRWMEDGKHLRLEFGTGAAMIIEASLDGDVLTIEKTKYKRVKQ